MNHGGLSAHPCRNAGCDRMLPLLPLGVEPNHGLCCLACRLRSHSNHERPLYPFLSPIDEIQRLQTPQGEQCQPSRQEASQVSFGIAAVLLSGIGTGASGNHQAIDDLHITQTLLHLTSRPGKNSVVLTSPVSCPGPQIFAPPSRNKEES